MKFDTSDFLFLNFYLIQSVRRPAFSVIVLSVREKTGVIISFYIFYIFMFTRIGNLRPKFWTLFLYVLISTFVLSSCNKDDENILEGEYAQGYLVVNEGVFGQNNSSVTHVSENNVVTQEVFQTVSGEILGDNLQSISILGDEAYLMVSNSNKIEVVHRGTFVKNTTITGDFANPRYMADIGNNKAYISTWGNFDDILGKILVLDTQTEQIISTIEAGSGAENLIFDSKTNKVFIANSFGTSVSVYNTSNNTLETTIDFSPNSPNQMVLDKNGDLWVTTRATDFSTYTSPTGNLYKINTATNEIETTISLNAGSENVGGKLAINPNKDILYYNFSSGIYELPITATAQATTPLILNGAYGLSVNPKNGDIWVGTANFQTLEGNEELHYDKNGNLQNTFATGAAPNQVIFLP
ncbi:gluconolactonase family protein [Bernardetia litoralis DSM 6794]|uniref:Gluconolactonase family protein n=2 Tax=Bernardetia litoralis TaxID=999 RepID=I4AQB4_BERLS|nr:gluconolactonase family protein [Bernardetia litoralis DSM 6794]